ncbi:hypothetical protein CFP56_037738 [Quercus suber]|uniref:Uncharacterized protein n=1 Tax=Quercus suber TaxID=58331 RepID=A0AAW0LNM7_QUESU
MDGKQYQKTLHYQSSGPHCWTFLSTAAYGKQNKVPQCNGREGEGGACLGVLPLSIFARVQLIQLIHLASPASLIRREELLHVVIGYLVQAYYRQLWQIISKVMIELALKSLLLV